MSDNTLEENGETESSAGFLSCVTLAWNSWYSNLSKNNSSARDSWEVDYKDITNMVYLGCGAQGVVSRGYLYGEMVAVKKVNDRKEIDIEHLRHLDHKNIVKFIGICAQSPDFCIIMEYCQYGSLFDFLHSGVTITPRQIQKWSKEIAEGMTYLHSQNIIHRDLKSPNILIGDGLVMKMSDFGTCRQWDEKSAKMSFIGTVAWMAPEVIRYEPCSDRIDVWSYGVVLWELLTLERPYGNMEMHAVMWGVGSETLSLPIPASLPNKLRVLMTQCWNQVPKNRPTFKVILSHIVPAGEELCNLYTENYTATQQGWRNEVLSAMANIRPTTPDISMEDNPTRREELMQARDLRNAYQEQVTRANDLYMDACSVRLQLEERERYLQEYIRDQACRCVNMKRTLGFVRRDSSTTPTPPSCSAHILLETNKNGAVVSAIKKGKKAKKRHPPNGNTEEDIVKGMGGLEHIPGFV